MSAVKEKAQAIVAGLPDDATWSDLAYEIELRKKIDEGLKDLDEGRSTPHEEVRKRFLGR
jgi:predicted transcriptional regulator